VAKEIVVGAVIQARTGSSRFPGKVFAQIAGKPLLGHILDRLRLCKTLHKIIIATTREPQDAEIIRFAESRGVPCFAGSTKDVQKRFLDAADEHGLDVIVRICGDSPFIDPEMTDRLVRELIEAGADYADPDPSIPAAYEGMEVATTDALRRSREVGDDGPDREHVTLYLRRHPGPFRLAHPVPPEDTRGKFRLSVDNHADLEFASAVYAGIYRPDRPFTASDVAGFINEHPEIAAINAHVHQKNPDAPDYHVAFFISRRSEMQKALALARELNENWHCGVGFFGNLTEDDEQALHRMGIRSAVFTSDDEDVIFKKVLKKWDAKVVLIDHGDEIFGARLFEMGWKIAYLTDPPERILR
jgi:spore coat polysaccharide biosynthesis protein SpsF